MQTFDTIRQSVEDTGLVCRGGFHPAPDDAVPVPGKTVLLLGNAGPSMWRAFSPQRGSEPNPLDAWTRRTVDALADRLGARALYPFDGPPFLPFQAWARKAEPVHPSPLGALIHSEFGLWHAYRGALVFEEFLDLPPRPTGPCPCDTCKARFCLAACPVQAFSPTRYDVQACTDHVAAILGEDCREGGCKARRACPVGTDFVYEPEQMRFHMAAFLKAYGPG